MRAKNLLALAVAALLGLAAGYLLRGTRPPSAPETAASPPVASAREENREGSAPTAVLPAPPRRPAPSPASREPASPLAGQGAPGKRSAGGELTVVTETPTGR